MAHFLKVTQNGNTRFINLDQVQMITNSVEDPDHTLISLVGEEGLVKIDEPLNVIRECLYYGDVLITY